MTLPEAAQRRLEKESAVRQFAFEANRERCGHTYDPRYADGQLRAFEAAFERAVLAILAKHGYESVAGIVPALSEEVR